MFRETHVDLLQSQTMVTARWFTPHSHGGGSHINHAIINAELPDKIFADDAMARVPSANSSRRFSAYGRKGDTVTAPKPPNA